MTPAPLARLILLAALATATLPHARADTMTLAPCPSSPNCVSSVASRDTQRVAPLRFTGDAAAAQARLVLALQQMRGATITEQRPGWISAEFRSRLLRFVDDVHLQLDARASVFHVRSASRVGYSDLGVNRRRVEDLRRRFEDG